MITLAIAVRNDYQGLFFTINSALLSVRNSRFENIQFAVLNNSDDEKARNLISNYCSDQKIPCKVITEFYSNHLGRNEAVRMSKTEYTVLADSHVLFAYGFFEEYYNALKSNESIGLIHSPFTSGGMPVFKANCFYNLMRFQYNLHGTFSHCGAEKENIYPVGLAPHAAYGFRTKEWLDFGGYIDQCHGHGGGEPFVTYKYWMFGKRACLTPKTGYIHFNAPKYRKNKGYWKRNHAISAYALGGPEIGFDYTVRLRQNHAWDEIEKMAAPYWEFVKSRQKIKFSELLDYFKKIEARPFIKR